MPRGLAEGPLGVGSSGYQRSIRMDKSGIRTINALHAEAEVKLFLGRIDRALDVQTDLIKDRCVLVTINPM